MSADYSQELETICDSIFAETGSDIAWKWDKRFQALLSEFPCEEEEEVLSLLERNFETCWDEENITDAPRSIKNIVGQIGNLRKEQLLYSTDPSRDVIVLGAYWPWNNGKKFSLRILMDMIQIDLDSGVIKESMGPSITS
jgi:hypothetical protein